MLAETPPAESGESIFMSICKGRDADSSCEAAVRTRDRSDFSGSIADLVCRRHAAAAPIFYRTKVTVTGQGEGEPR